MALTYMCTLTHLYFEILLMSLVTDLPHILEDNGLQETQYDSARLNLKMKRIPDWEFHSLIIENESFMIILINSMMPFEKFICIAEKTFKHQCSGKNDLLF